MRAFAAFSLDASPVLDIPSQRCTPKTSYFLRKLRRCGKIVHVYYHAHFHQNISRTFLQRTSRTTSASFAHFDNLALQHTLPPSGGRKRATATRGGAQWFSWCMNAIGVRKACPARDARPVRARRAPPWRGVSAHFGDFYPSMLSFSSTFGNVRLKLWRRVDICCSRHATKFQRNRCTTRTAGLKKRRMQHFSPSIEHNSRILASSGPLWAQLGTPIGGARTTWSY